MSKRGDIKDLEVRVTFLEALEDIDTEVLEARVSALEEVVDFLTQDIEEDLPDEFISESDLVHEAYASHAAYPHVDTHAFVTGYIARAKEEEGIYAP